MKDDFIDFSNCKSGNRFYDGANKKISILYDNKNYILKFQNRIVSEKRNDLNSSYSNSAISEYLGSKIMNSIGLNAQNVLLGFYREKIAVACEDFNTKEWKLQEFSKISNACLNTTSLGRTPKVEEIMATIEHFDMFKDKETMKLNYWEIVVGDAIIGNFDRHGGNWGYMVNEQTGEIELAPIYDCGSGLYPQLSDENIPKILQNPQEINDRIHKYPKPALTIEGIRPTYKEVLSQEENTYIRQALINVASKINLQEINTIIENTPIITDIRKDFYKTMIEQRIEQIIEPALEKHKQYMLEHSQDFSLDEVLVISNLHPSKTKDALLEHQYQISEPEL